MQGDGVVVVRVVVTDLLIVWMRRSGFVFSPAAGQLAVRIRLAHGEFFTDTSSQNNEHSRMDLVCNVIRRSNGCSDGGDGYLVFSTIAIRGER